MSPQGKTSASTHTLVVISSDTTYVITHNSPFAIMPIPFVQNGPVSDNYIQIPTRVSSHV
jgi:hypothetical protein